MRVKLRYVDSTTWSVPSGVVYTAYQFMTSLFSPRVSGGHQPYFYDQYTPGMFTKYRVYGVKYRITAINNNCDVNWCLLVRPQNTPVAETNYQTLMERKDTKIRQGTSTTGSKTMVVCKGYMSTAKTLGIHPSEISNDEYYAAEYNTVAVRSSYLYPYMVQNSGVNKSFDVNVELLYYAELFNRAVPAGS